MELEDVLSLLERMVAPEAEPTLDEKDLEALATLAQRVDSEGNLPSDASWEPTWDVYYAAAEGWRWKAAKAAEMFNFGEDGQNFSRAQVFANCIAQANMYAARGFGTIPIGEEEE